MNIHIYSIILVLSIAVFAIACTFIWKKSMPLIYPTPVPEKIAGGMILLAIIIGAGAVMSFYTVVKFLLAGFDFEAMGLRLSASDDQAGLVTFFEVFTLISYAFSFVSGIFLFYLMMMKRDIFPVVYLYTFIIGVINAVVSMVFTNMLFSMEKIVWIISVVMIALVIIFGGLITLYATRSRRSKAIFVLPHPSKVNHEDEDFLKELTK